jgi:GNAT superfamily N-acetyltransferase
MTFSDETKIFISGEKEYRFNEESFTEALGELTDILQRNHEETGIYDKPFNPDINRLVDLEQAKVLRFMSIRFQGRIVGYSIVFVDSEIFQKDVICATQSATFVDKEHRGIGYAFIKFCDDILKKQGINSVWRQSSAKHDVSKVYERHGYQYIEKSFLRRL